jgi:hypothetical protein
MTEKLPALHFYVQDYLADTRCLSNELKGFYVDILCYMHKASRRGYLSHPTGNPYSPQQLAAMTGCSADEASRLLQALLNSEVISATHQGVPFSRRMVRDEKKRQLGIKFGKKGGNPTLKGTLKGDRYPIPEDENEEDPDLLPRGKEKPILGEKENSNSRVRARNLIWDALCSTFGMNPITESEKKRMGKIAREYRDKGVDPGEIPIRAGRYRKMWPQAAFTAEALFRHWDLMGRDHSKGVNGASVDRDEITATMDKVLREESNANL